MKLRKFIAKTIRKSLNESSSELMKQDAKNAATVFGGKIRGRFLTSDQVDDLQKEIEANYVNGDMRQHFNREKDDIRMKVFNFDEPIAEKTLNGVVLKIVSGLVRGGEKTYLLYADDLIIGEFYSVDDIKKIIKYIEDGLVKNLPDN
jgi:methyl coenzyme M reductase subunit C